MEVLLIPNVSTDFYLAAAPLFVLAFAGIMAALFPRLKGSSVNGLYALSIVSLGLALVLLCVPAAPEALEVFWNGAYLADNLAHLGQFLILGTALALVLLFKESYLANYFFTREMLSLFFLVILGMLVMVSSVDLVTLFVGLELSSIGIYVLVGYVFPRQASLEGAIKYFILGAFASAFLLFGFGLLYASSSTLNIAEFVHKNSFIDPFWVKIGITLILVGLSFKLALMPFHMWAPDAYEAAPTGITALMATSVKVMLLIVAIRLTRGHSAFAKEWYPILFTVSALSMLGGNILALVQTSVKRMLAYSSIAHSGYMAIALAIMNVGKEMTYEAMLFYLIAYILTSILAFGTLMYLEDTNRQNLQIDDLKGLVQNHPWAAFFLATAMFSLAGMPPTIGFFGKFFVFNAALREHLYSLVIIGVLGSVISLYFYLRVIVAMYMQKPASNTLQLTPQKSFVSPIILGLSCLAVLILGTVFPEQILSQLKPISSKISQR